MEVFFFSKKQRKLKIIKEGRWRPTKFFNETK
jgi:hypothetical protein